MLGSYPQCYYNNRLWFGSVVQNSFMITPKWFFILRKYSFNFLQIQAMFTSNQVINMVTSRSDDDDDGGELHCLSREAAQYILHSYQVHISQQLTKSLSIKLSSRQCLQKVQFLKGYAPGEIKRSSKFQRLKSYVQWRTGLRRLNIKRTVLHSKISYPNCCSDEISLLAEVSHDELWTIA